MINKLLHALSNRKGPFEEPLFIPDPGFLPATLGESEQKLRQQMLLDVVNTDYYLKAYLSCVEAYPDIHQQTGDDVRTYQMRDFPPLGVEISGGEMTSNTNMVGFFTDPKPTTVPVNLVWTLAYLDTTYLTIHGVDTGIVRRTTFHASGTAPHQTLRIDWPADVPFQGPVNLNLIWEPGALLTIRTAPSAFPFQVITERLRSNWYLMHLLAKHVFVDEYVACLDHQRKIALACVVLALENPSVYPA